MKNTLLIDGGYLLKKCKTATFDKYNTYNYGDTIFVFFNTIHKILKTNIQINKIVLFWDGENGGKFRHDFYPQYKANRKSKSWYSQTLTENEVLEIDNEKKSLLFVKTKIKNYLEEFFIRQIEIPMIEADDLMSGYINIAYKTENLYIYTNDRDYCQFLNKSENIQLIFDTKKEKTNNDFYTKINRQNFSKYFDYHYRNCVLYKTILGDTSDNIFGVKNFADKRLFDIMPEFKTRKVELSEILEIARKQWELKPNQYLTSLVFGLDKLFYDKVEKIYLKLSKNENSIIVYDDYKTKEFEIFEDIENVKNILNKSKTPIITLLEYIEKMKNNINDKFVVYILDKFCVIYGERFYERNERLTNLEKPFLTEECFEELQSLKDDVLNAIDENGKINRGSKFLMKMIYEDRVLMYRSNYTKTFSENFIDYIKPFYKASGTEFLEFKEYCKNNNIKILD